ncbi:STAS domain-containing protein [Mycolicibacterium sp. F2034L]|uniref:STAS domain-containing protein n=1 Tax=Mycolicibacterium sp. F2034L TaxID=2926422 RepID=UPI001FF57E9C|nr:STAS domain-containing protein [Mycolicibacterium sp. F2034L]MCK0176123.1 STAS domain-containing protein [Mycolicibacterium sp. F2034L]
MDPNEAPTEEWHGQIVVVRAAGAIDMVTAPPLLTAIRAAHAQRPKGVIVDLTEVEFLSSAGMQTLVTAHQEIVEQARFAVVADGPGTSRPLKIMGLTDFIELFTTRDAALDTLSE